MSAAFHTIGAVQIPRGMIWEDELSWNPMQSASERGLTGALIVDAALRVEGQPMTLVGSESAGWISRETLQALHALAAAPGAGGAVATHAMELADGREFEVIFAPDAEPIEARPIARPELPEGSHPYAATLRLVITAAL